MTIPNLLRGALALGLGFVLALPVVSEEPHESAKQLYDKAEALTKQGEYEQAFDLYERAKALWVESGDLKLQAECWYGMAESQRGLGQGERAVDLYSETLALLRQIGARTEEAIVLYHMGGAYEELGQWQGARESHEASLALWRELGRSLEQANPLRGLGDTLLELEEVTAACDAYENAFELSELSGEPKEKGLSWNGLGRCRFARGEMVEAIDAFETAIKLGCQVDSSELQAGAHNNLAGAHRRQGNLSAALEHQFAANKLWEQRGQKAAIADGLQNLGNLYVALGQQHQALARYQEALELYRKMGRPNRVALSRLSVSWVRLFQGEVAVAVADLERLHTEQIAVSDPRLAAEVARALGRAYLAAGRRDQAKTVFEQEVARGRERSDLAGLARSLTGLGEACAARRESACVSASFTEALELGRTLRNPAIEAASLHGLARLARDRGELEAALDLAEQALERIERRRSLVPTPELRATFLAEQRDYYELHLALLLRLHQLHPERRFDVAAFEASERARARGLLDLLSERGEDAGTPREPVFAEREQALNAQLVAVREQLDELRPDERERRETLVRRLSKVEEALQQLELEIRDDPSFYGELRLGSPATLEQAQQLLEPATALVEYALGDESSLGFVVTRGQPVHSFKIAATAAEIKARVEKVRGALATPGRRGLGAYRSEAWSLYQLLLGPAEARLAGVERLVVVPDRSLHTLPFEALLTAPPDAAAGGLGTLPYLLARWSVSYAPSASVLGLLARAKSGSPAPAAPTLVAFADPPYTDPLSPLPASATEVKSIAALYPPEQVRLFLGRQASEANVKHDTAVRTARRLHFATHGLLDERWPQLSALALSRDQEDSEDGQLRVYEIFRLDLTAELVVLSACETALGEEVRGEGLIGLARAFLYAGASRVAVSLWRVEDTATAELMPRFYRHLADQPSTTAALRAAKLELIRGGAFSHPAYWASFILIGWP